MGRFNGLVNNKVVGISAAADNKGFVLTTKAQERLQARQGHGQHHHEGRSQEFAPQGQGSPQQAEIQEGPLQGRSPPRRPARQVPEASASQEGSQGPCQERIKFVPFSPCDENKELNPPKKKKKKKK